MDKNLELTLFVEMEAPVTAILEFVIDEQQRMIRAASNATERRRPLGGLRCQGLKLAEMRLRLGIVGQI